MTEVVYVFAKPPRIGVSKTRLAKGIGDIAAARLAAAFLSDTVDGLRSAGLRPILATTEPAADFGLLLPIARVEQGDGPLGRRLARVLGRGLEHAGAVAAMGADSPGLPPKRLGALALALQSGQPSVIPATDGGFVALSLTTVPVGAFDDVPWSADNTLAVLEARFADRGVELEHLPGWFDIDEQPDLDLFRERVDRVNAPATWAVLDSL